MHFYKEYPVSLSKETICLTNSVLQNYEQLGTSSAPLVCITIIHVQCFNIPQDPNIIWDANISLSVIPLSPFLGTFILLDVDNLLFRCISE